MYHRFEQKAKQWQIAFEEVDQLIKTILDYEQPK